MSVLVIQYLMVYGSTYVLVVFVDLTLSCCVMFLKSRYGKTIENKTNKENCMNVNLYCIVTSCDELS